MKIPLPECKGYYQQTHNLEKLRLYNIYRFREKKIQQSSIVKHIFAINKHILPHTCTQAALSGQQRSEAASNCWNYAHHAMIHQLNSTLKVDSEKGSSSSSVYWLVLSIWSHGKGSWVAVKQCLCVLDTKQNDGSLPYQSKASATPGYTTKSYKIHLVRMLMQHMTLAKMSYLSTSDSSKSSFPE